jgi:hypothetical protein
LRHRSDEVTTQPKTKFEPIELKAVPSWYVRVAFANGEQTYVGGFDTEVVAREWIGGTSTSWLEIYKNGRYL